MFRLPVRKPVRTAATGSAVLLLAAATIGTTGCAGTTTVPAGPRYEVEIETVEDQARAAVDETPLEFTVPLMEADEAWARARLFISEYTSGDGTPREVSPRHAFVTNEGQGTDRFTYRIDRTVTPRGYAFVVACRPREQGVLQPLAEHNGRNIARFIRVGTLEVSLLNR